jgi:hypothetical protein
MARADDPLALLDQAVLEARRAGRDCDGWTMQATEEGYVAWLFRDDDDEGQWSLFDQVEVMPSAGAAARWCLEQVRT